MHRFGASPCFAMHEPGPCWWAGGAMARVTHGKTANLLAYRARQMRGDWSVSPAVGSSEKLAVACFWPT